MTLRREKLQRARLYLVVGSHSASGRPAEEIVREAVMGGVDIVQLRMKGASTAELTQKARTVGRAAHGLGALFIVNDDPVAAAESGADGVHVGQDDFSVAEARRRAAAAAARELGQDFLIGKSTHSPEQAKAAAAEGADYLGFGPMFATPTKPDYRAIGPDQIRTILRGFSQPFFAIGGIDERTAPQVLAMGAQRIAVVRAVQDAPDVRAAAAALKKLLLAQEAHA